MTFCLYRSTETRKVSGARQKKKHVERTSMRYGYDSIWQRSNAFCADHLAISNGLYRESTIGLTLDANKVMVFILFKLWMSQHYKLRTSNHPWKLGLKRPTNTGTRRAIRKCPNFKENVLSSKVWPHRTKSMLEKG